MTTENSETTAKPRSIDELYPLPYSEMTEEEIERVVEFKANLQARNKANAERLEAITAASKAMIEQNEKQYQEAKAAQDKLLSFSLERLAKVNS